MPNAAPEWQARSDWSSRELRPPDHSRGLFGVPPFSLIWRIVFSSLRHHLYWTNRVQNKRQSDRPDWRLNGGVELLCIYFFRLD